MKFRKLYHRGSQFKFIFGSKIGNFGRNLDEFQPHGGPQECNFSLCDYQWLILFKNFSHLHNFSEGKISFHFDTSIFSVYVNQMRKIVSK